MGRFSCLLASVSAIKTNVKSSQLKSTPLYFSTQIYHEKLMPRGQKLNRLIKDVKTEAFQIEAMDDVGYTWSLTNYKNGYTSYSSQDQLHKLSSTFSGLESKIRRHVQKYLERLDYQANVDDLVMTDFWVNIMYPNTIHTAHIHPHSVISGTFYVSTPKGCSGIKFEDPRLGFFMNSPEVKPGARLYNQRFLELKPQAGDIALFESWLRHEVPLNSSKEPRISVSFNYGWKK